MKYAIIGAGGTGGCLGFFLEKAGKETVVIPILNIYGTGGRLQKKLPELTVPDGCIYVSANILEPGVILQHGKILRVVFGARKPEEETEKMREVTKDMASDEMEVVLSENIRRDAMVKFSYVSPIGAAGLYCNAVAADFQREGEQREMFKALICEITALSHAMGIEFEEDLVERNLKILASLSPEATTSMQRDVMEGKRSEMDGLVYEVVRMGREYKVSMPQYEKAAACFREQGIL